MKKIVSFIAIVLTLAVVSSCTKLDEELYNVVEVNDYGKTPSEIKTIVGRAYASLRGYREGNKAYYATEFIWFLNETSSDEAVIPTRGFDWYDGGIFQQTETHTWDTNNDLLLNSWKYLYTGISKVNAVIYQVNTSELEQTDKDKINAELRGLRAYYYYRLCDMFGNVPLQIDYSDLELKPNTPRAQIYSFIETELLEIVEYLPETGYGKFTRAAAYTLLARLYLNAEVFKGSPEWQKCIDACEMVSGYTLEPNFSANFAKNNETSRENIFVIPFDEAVTTGNFQQSLTLHYKAGQIFGFNTVCVNGISAQPGVYSKFDDNDVRKKSMLEGEQYDINTGQIIMMNDGNPLNHTEEIFNWKDAMQNEGVRNVKYEITPTDQWERSNDWVIMRYSEVLLMKAEALMRLGTPDLARPLIDAVRTRAGLETPETVDLEFLNDELLREFLWEEHRRTDNIRFGKFTQAWWVKDESEPHRTLFPIPREIMEGNSRLQQNPGY